MGVDPLVQLVCFCELIEEYAGLEHSEMRVDASALLLVALVVEP